MSTFACMALGLDPWTTFSTTSLFVPPRPSFTPSRKVFLASAVPSTQKKSDISTTRAVLQYGGIGSAAALSAFFFVYPLDVVKKDMQVRDMNEGYIKTIQSIYSQGGAARFFRGTHLAIMEVVASRFVAFGMAEGLRRWLPSQWDETSLGKLKKGAVSAIFGAWVKAAIFCPIDSIKTRFQTIGRFEHTVHQPTTTLGIVRQVWGQSSFRGLYRGFTNLGLKGSLNFVPFYVGMDMANHYIPAPEKLWKRVLRDALVGASVTLFSDLFTYPLDVVKNVRQASIKNAPSDNIRFHEGGEKFVDVAQEKARVAVSGESQTVYARKTSRSLAAAISHFFHNPQSTLSLLRLIYNERGVAGLYRGFYVPGVIIGPRIIALFVGGGLFGATYTGLRRLVSGWDQKRLDASSKKSAV